jgi:hypothetical protein
MLPLGSKCCKVAFLNSKTFGSVVSSRSRAVLSVENEPTLRSKGGEISRRRNKHGTVLCYLLNYGFLFGVFFSAEEGGHKFLLKLANFQ